LADSVAKVEKMGCRKIYVRAGATRKPCSRALPRGWESPWLPECPFEWTPTCFFEWRLHDPEKIGPTQPGDFCNKMGPLRPVAHVTTCLQLRKADATAHPPIPKTPGSVIGRDEAPAGRLPAGADAHPLPRETDRSRSGVLFAGPPPPTSGMPVGANHEPQPQPDAHAAVERRPNQR
jgi:hypothetical protein